MTTRKFHRNSTMAFPKTADYASAVERSRKDDRLILRSSAVIALVFVLMALAGWLE